MKNILALVEHDFYSFLPKLAIHLQENPILKVLGSVNAELVGEGSNGVGEHLRTFLR